MNALETARSWQLENKDRELVVQVMIDKLKQTIKYLIEDRNSLNKILKELHRDFIISNQKRKQLEEQLKKKMFGYSIDSVYQRRQFTRHNSDPDFLSAVIIKFFGFL